MTQASGHIVIHRRKKDGANGVTGCIYRRSVWEAGKVYHNDSDLNTNDIKYIDMVTDVPIALIGKTPIHAYMCKKTHTSSVSNQPGGPLSGVYWKEIPLQEPTFAPLLLATQISADFIDVESIAAAEAFINNLVVKQLATDSGKVKILNNGSIEALDGKMIGLTTKRMRNPFKEVKAAGWELLDDDTVYSNSLNIPFMGDLDWTTASSGRRVTLIGSFKFTAPTGKYFYIDGKFRNSLDTSFELTELIGFGSEEKFGGWAVVGRHPFQTNYALGRELKPVAFGIVTCASASLSTTIRTFDGSSISVTRTGQGKYYMYVPRAWFYSDGSIMCQLTGYGKNTTTAASVSPIYANLYAITATTYGGSNVWRLEIHTSDDSTEDDGGFQFMLYNMNAWDDVQYK